MPVQEHPLAGVYAAALTPLREDFSPDPASLPAYLGFLARRGCHGALLFGTTGEGPSFSAAERLPVLKAALEVKQAHPGFRLLAGTGSPSLEESISLTRAAFELGYEGVVTLPPYYFRQASEDGLFQWFDLLIKKAVPAGSYLLGYHIPSQAGIGLSLNLLSRLKDAHPQKFAGIKDSSGDPQHAAALGTHFGADLLVLNGNDGLALHALQHQAGGAITAAANLFSPLLRQIWDCYVQDADARSAQQALKLRRDILNSYAPFPSILKLLMARLHGFPNWPVRPPLTSLPAETVQEALQALQSLPGGVS